MKHKRKRKTISRMREKYKAGQRVNVFCISDARWRKSNPATVIKDYGRFVLVSLGNHRECFFKEEMEVA